MESFDKMSYSKRQGGSYEGRRGHGKGFKRCPIELDEKIEVDITEMSPKNEGIAKVQGFIIHVPNAKLGDHIIVKIVKLGEKTANAEIIK